MLSTFWERIQNLGFYRDDGLAVCTRLVDQLETKYGKISSEIFVRTSA